jgi:predicted RecA/RadA family phage recombinase
VNDLVLLTNIVGVAIDAIAAAETGTVAVRGVFTVQKTTGEAWTQGQQLYYVAATGKLTTTAGSNKKAGTAEIAAASADTTGNVNLNLNG